VTYQGYNINGYMFYTEQQDKKTCIRIVMYVLMLMMLRAKTKICTMVKYKRYGSLTFTVSRFLFSIAIGLIVDVSYPAPQAHRIVNVALHREYSPGMIFIFSIGRISNMSKTNTKSNSNEYY
jgi:hypothetical protein